MTQSVILYDETIALLYRAKSIIMKHTKKNVTNEKVVYTALNEFILGHHKDLEELIKCQKKTTQIK